MYKLLRWHNKLFHINLNLALTVWCPNARKIVMTHAIYAYDEWGTQRFYDSYYDLYSSYVQFCRYLNVQTP